MNLGLQNQSGLSKRAIKSPKEKNGQNESHQSGKRCILETCCRRRDGLGVGFWPLWLGQSMVSDDICDWIVHCHVWWVTIFCGSFSVKVWLVMTTRRISSKRKFEEAFTNFLKTVGLLVFQGIMGCFCHLQSFPCFLVRSWPLWMVFLKHPSVFIFFV